MKKYMLLLLLCVTINGVLFAQAVIETKAVRLKVGKQPVAIFPAKQTGSFDINSNELNIICYGLDANWNGIFDEGDELPSWWKIINVNDANPFEDKPTEPIIRKVMNFDMSVRNYLLPAYRFRIAEEIDKVPVLHANLLPISFGDSVVFYDMATEAKKGHTLLDAGAGIVSTCFYSNFVFATSREYDADYNSISNISMYKAHDFNKIISHTLPNSFIQRVIAYEYVKDGMHKATIAVLYEGAWSMAGTPGKLEFHTTKDGIGLSEITSGMAWEDCFDIKTIDVGLSVNDMSLLNPIGVPFLFVVSSGDNRIYTIDAYTQEVDGFKIGIDDGYIQIPADIPGSIREFSLLGQSTSALITSYNDSYVYYIGNIMHTNEEGGIVKLAVESGGWTEGSALFNNFSGYGLQCAYTVIYSDDIYTANDEVELVFQNVLSIYENNNSLKVFPNPVSNIINVELEDISDINSIKLTNNAGNQIDINEYSIDGNNIQLNIPNLQTGNYFIELDMKNRIHTQKIIIK